MPDPLTFLVVDDHSENRYLLVKTLIRKFPGCACIECEDSDTAVSMLTTRPLTAVVAHRASDMDGLPLVEKLRAATPLPIVLVSGVDREAGAKKAGANAFLHYDAWLRIGTVMADLLARRAEGYN